MDPTVAPFTPRASPGASPPSPFGDPREDVVVECGGPHDFYAHRVTQAQRRAKLQAALQQEYAGNKARGADWAGDTPKVGQWLCARWDDDDSYSHFYRCVVEEVLDVGRSYYVRQLDFGHGDLADLNQLFKLPPSLSQVEPFALHCRLQGWDSARRRDAATAEKFKDLCRRADRVRASFRPSDRKQPGEPDFLVNLTLETDMLETLLAEAPSPEEEEDGSDMSRSDEALQPKTTESSSQGATRPKRIKAGSVCAPPPPPPIEAAAAQSPPRAPSPIDPAELASAQKKVGAWLQGGKFSANSGSSGGGALEPAELPPPSLASSSSRHLPPPPPRPKSPDMAPLIAPVGPLNASALPPLRPEHDKDNRLLVVTIPYVESPDHFYLHLNQPETHEYDVLEQSLYEQFYKSPELRTGELEKLPDGSLLAVFDDGAWQRAELLAKADGGSAAYVKLVDFGDVLDVPASACRVLSEKLCKLPAIAVRCRLPDISYPDGADYYPDAAADAIRALNDGKELRSALFVHYDEKERVLEADLLLRAGEGRGGEGGEGSGVGKGSGGGGGEGKLLTQLLVEKGLARYKDEDDDYTDVADERQWDPMADHFKSQRNNYEQPEFRMDENDELSLSKKKKICTFYAATRSCRRGKSCQFHHIFQGDGFRPTDPDEFTTAAYHEQELPALDAVVLLSVTCVTSPGSFFANLPLGAFDLARNSAKLAQRRFEREETLETLHKSMKQRYGQSNFVNRKPSVTANEIVVVNCPRDVKRWYRARVLDTDHCDTDDDDLQQLSVLVLYVDFGNAEWVGLERVRKIEVEFLHLPFQAFECQLSGVEPLCDLAGDSSGPGGWPKRAVDLFSQLVSSGTTYARVRSNQYQAVAVDLVVARPERGQQASYVELDVADELVRAGLARRADPAAAAYRPPPGQVIHVPG